jgi:DnaJ family protein C protein 9
MHSTYEDEARFIMLIDKFISTGVLKSTKTWTRNSKDEKAKLVREKQGKKEAVEAEALAKELGVWDEFYGTGKEGTRRGKGKGKAAGKGKDNAEKAAPDEQDEDIEDTAALQALILGRKKNMDGFFDNLAAKYAEPEPRSKGKRKKGDIEEEGGPSKKSRSRAAKMPDIPDEEFERLQQNLFGDKGTSAGKSKSRIGKRT